MCNFCANKPWTCGRFIYNVNGFVQTHGGPPDYKPLGPPNYKLIYYQLCYKDDLDKIIKIQRLYKRYKWNKIKNTLWFIAEYYTKKKYSPDDILNYITLDDNFQLVDVNELD